MNGYKTYILYLALKAHFTRADYDFFKYGGRVSSNVDSFEARKDKYLFEKATKYYPTKVRMLGFLLSNFLENINFYIGDFQSLKCEKIYQEWLGKTQSLRYSFEQDLQKVKEESEKRCVTFRKMFRLTSGEMSSPFLEMTLNRNVNIETYIIVNRLLGLGEYYDGKIIDPLYDEFSFKVKKYNPFIQLDRAVFAQTFKRFI